MFLRIIGSEVGDRIIVSGELVFCLLIFIEEERMVNNW